MYLDLEKIPWCSGTIESDDIKYIRFDVHEESVARWREDSTRQAATINRLAEAAKDRDEVDSIRQKHYEQDIAEKDAEIAALKQKIDWMKE